MGEVPSAGWREVYRWCQAEQPEVAEQIEAARRE